MREILPLLRSTSLFTGLTEEETESLLSALHGEMRAFDREELLLRAGQPVRAFGVLLSGGALVRQEDFWGNQNILSSLRPGDCFAETFACLPGAALNVDVAASQPCEALFLETQGILTGGPSAHAGGARFLQNFLVNLRRSLTWASAAPGRRSFPTYRPAPGGRAALNLTLPFHGSN